MTPCPNCGTPVPDNQRFCGNCGADLAAVRAVPEQQPAGNAEPSAAGYGYQQPEYPYPPAQGRQFSPLFVIVALAIAAIACLCCGIVVGAGLIYLLTPASVQPVIPPAPTPAGWLPLLFRL